MLNRVHFDSPLTATADQIKGETMVFSADPIFAIDNGGPLTQAIVERLLGAGAFDLATNVVIDTRVHMLKPDWLPAIGGWHCDAIPRGKDGQPELDHPIVPHIRHYLCVVDVGTGALTEFWDDPSVAGHLPKVASPGKNLWGEHSELINTALQMVEPYGSCRERSVTTVSSGEIYEFSAQDYHRAIPAVADGWRYFFRASVNTLTRGPLNEIRSQVQVYLPSQDLGW